MNLQDLTLEKQTSIAQDLVKEAGLVWDDLSEKDKNSWLIEASFCVSWFCE